MTWLATIYAAIKAWGATMLLGQKVADAAHDATERKAGSDAATAATQQATIASVERQNQAAVNAPGVEGTIGALEKDQF